MHSMLHLALVRMPDLRGLVAAFDAALATWAERRAQRHALASLLDEPRLLRDLALSPGDVLEEISKPFWRA